MIMNCCRESYSSIDNSQIKCLEIEDIGIRTTGLKK